MYLLAPGILKVFRGWTWLSGSGCRKYGNLQLQDSAGSSQTLTGYITGIR